MDAVVGRKGRLGFLGGLLCRRAGRELWLSLQRPPQTVVHPAYLLLTSASTRPSTDLEHTDLEPARQPLAQEVQVHLASAAGQSDAAAFLARPRSLCRIFSPTSLPGAPTAKALSRWSRCSPAQKLALKVQGGEGEGRGSLLVDDDQVDCAQPVPFPVRPSLFSALAQSSSSA